MEESEVLGALAGRDVFPDASSVFSWQPSPFADIQDICLVVPDTNTLVVPYTLSPSSLEEIGEAYQSLVQQNRLIVPGQVAREFAKIRIIKLAEHQKQLLDQKSKDRRLATENYPLLGSDHDYQHALSVARQINELIVQYQSALGMVADRVRQWSWADPVSELYRELFPDAVVLDPPFELAEMEQDLKQRKAAKRPPGYKDDSKEENRLGDLLIWHTILTAAQARKQHIVFVTEDKKSDWWHRSAETTLFPRYELVEEFRRASSGQSFYLMTFYQFLDWRGASMQLLDEVRRQESEPGGYAQQPSNALRLFDGAIVVVRHESKIGAVKALRQMSQDVLGTSGEKAGIDYEWWYEPDGSNSFNNAAVQHGSGHTEEGSGFRPSLFVGPIELQWSSGGAGSGWVYFGPSSSPSPDYELALTVETDIEDVDAAELTFLRGR
jgi:hypothetical protein